MSDIYALEAPESARATVRRRLQQQRCLVCGARDLVNHQTSYFCQLHIGGWRYCSLCETLRTKREHGKDSRCRSCASSKALEWYRQNSERNIYRTRLKQLASRTTTRGDQIFANLRRRIALADLVKRTPGMSWPKRAAMVGGNATQLAHNYRWQLSGQLRDVDAADRARDAYWQAAS